MKKHRLDKLTHPDGASFYFNLLNFAKFDVILIRFSSFSILYRFENNDYSTHYFSFHTLLVPIQYQLFFVIIVCSSCGLQVGWTIQRISVRWFASPPMEIIISNYGFCNKKFCGTNQ